MNKLNQVMAAIILLFVSQAMASDNSVYIDQTGDNSVITMTQDGSANRIRGIQGTGTGNTTPSKIVGNNVTLTVDQIGSGNILNLGVDTATSNGGVDTSIAYSVSGNNAVATIDMNNNGQGTAESNTISIDQTGDSTVANINMLGSNNVFNAATVGNSNEIVAVINADQVNVLINKSGGTGNITTLNLTGDKGSVDLTVLGATNTTDITQSGGGVLGHVATVNIDGSGNNTTIVQGGSIDTTVNLVAVGSGNTFNITTGN